MLLTLVMTLSLVPTMGVTASAAENGSGTADDPYVVTTYEELQTAMQKAGGSYVRLDKDIDTTNMNDGNGIGRANQIVVNSNVSLDLHGHKVTLLKYNTERSGLIDVRRGSLTIENSKGSGELNGKNMTTGTRLHLIECYDGAKVTVNSGKLTMWSAQTAQTANAVIKNSGTVEINGGTLVSSREGDRDERDFYLVNEEFAVNMGSGGSAVINGGTFDGRVLLFAHAKTAGKAGSVINGGDFKKSVYVRKDRTKTGDVALDVSIRGGTYHYTTGYYTNDEGNKVSDPQHKFQFTTLGFLDADSPYYDVAPYLHGADPAEGKLDKYDLKAFRSIFPTNAILVAKGQSYTHRDYRTGNETTEVRLVDKLFTGADDKTEWARLMNSEYQTIDVVSDIQLEDATLKVGDTIVPDNGGNVATGDKTITITGKVNKRIAELVNGGKIDLGFGLNVVKTTKPMKYLDTKAATLSTASNSDGRLNVTVTLPSAQLVKADYSVRLDLFSKKPGTTTTPVGEGLFPSGWKLSADSANHPVTINYNANGGGGTMVSQKVMSGKQPYTLPNCTFTAPAAGQVFKGWSTAQDGTGILSDGKLPLTDVESSVTVYAIWGAPTEMEIDKVTLSVKNYSQRQSTDDFRVVDRTPYKEMSSKGFWVREGLNNKDGDAAKTYDKTKDYSVVYEFEAVLGYQFAENISVDDVSANDGEVWFVGLFNNNKTLQVCVNYRSGDSIKGMRLKVKEPLAGDSSRDDAYEIRSTDGRYTVEYTDWYQGEITDSGYSGAKFYGDFAAGEQYTCAFRVKANDGYKVAPGYTAGLYLNGAQVTNCKELVSTGDDAGGYYGLYTFTVMDTSDKIRKVGIQVKPAADRADISTDFGPQKFTPASRMELQTYQIYEGLNQTSGDRPTAYDPAKDYSAIYEFTAGGSYSFAEGISTSDVTINDGQVWQVKRLKEGKTLQVYVNFYSGDDIIKGMRLKVKEPTAGTSSRDAAYEISSTDSRYTVEYTDWYQGEFTDNSQLGITKFTGEFEAGQKYTCAFRVKANAGYKVAHGYTGALYLNEAKVTNCTELVSTGDNAEGYYGLYTFTAVDAPDPTPETKTIEKINLDFKPYSDRSKLDDLTPTYTPGTDMMKLSTKIFCEGDALTSTTLDDNDAYDLTKSYTALFHFNFEDGVTIAEDFAQKDVSVSNGIIKEVRRNDTFTVIVVNFPKDPTTDPNYVTEAAVKVAAPVAGEHPNGPVYLTVTSGNADKFETALMFWFGMNDSDTFEVGKEYTANVYLKPKAGVTLADDMKLKINGKDAKLVKNDDSDGSVQFQLKIAAVDSSTPAPTEYAVTVTSGGNGSASANHDTAVAGTEIKLTAKADSGYHFKEWEVVSGGVTIKDNKFNMPEDNVEIKAIFEKDASVPIDYTVTVTSGGNGSASANHNTAVAGTEIKLTAKADSGYHFKEWEVVSGGVTVKDNKFNMPEGNVEIKAIFEKNASSGGGGVGSSSSVTKYAVTISSADNGKVTSDKTRAAKDSVVTITTKANDGYVLDTIKATDKAGKEIKLTDKGDGKYTFTMPASKVEVKAAFKQTASKPGKPAEEMKTVVVMQIGSKTMFVNGKAYEKDAAPVIMNDRTLVPIRFVTESLGGKVAWNAETKEVTLVIDGKEIKMTIGKTIEKYGVAPVIINGRTFVPVRFVADELGATTAWNAETKTVTITKAVIPMKTEK